MTTQTMQSKSNLIEVITENTIDSIISIDEKGIIVFFNKAAEKLFGFSKEEAIGQSVNIIVPSPNKEAHDGYLEHYIKTGETKIMGKEREIQAQQKDGTLIEIGLTVNEVFQDDKRYFTAVLRDIAERKYLEGMLVQAKDDAESANQQKSNFLANVSHDIRTPMNGIIGMSELLLNTPQNEEQELYTNMIMSSGELLLSLINDLLDLSKIESAESIELNPSSVIIEDLAEEMIQSFVTQAQKNNVTLKKIVDSKLPRAIKVDTMRIKQILINLMGNAIKFTKYGDVTLQITNKGELDGEVTILFEVIDTGIGIPADKQDLIFNKFTQAEKHTASRYGGTGLGLAICKSLVELMDGHIAVKSKSGEGSNFWFQVTLPIAHVDPDAHKTTITKRDHKIDTLFEGAVLVVEDFPANQLVMRNILEKMGCTVTIAESGETALENINANTYDLIFMDCMLPGIDGYQVTEKVRESGKSDKELPIIAVTASNDKKDWQQCLDSGMNTWLEKPVKIANMKVVLEAYLKVK